MSKTGYVILGMLAHGLRTGYEIKRLVDVSTRFFWAASYGQIYPELRRLESDGLIVGESRPSGERRRTVYQLTERGREALHDWLLTPDAGYELRDVGLLKLFFASALDTDEAVALVRRLRGHRERLLESLRDVERNPNRPRGGFGDLVLDYGIGFHEWAVDWCNRTEEQLHARARTTQREADA